MKLDIAIQKFIKYRIYVQRISQNSRSCDKWALKRFHEFMFTKYSMIVDVEEITFDDFVDYSEFMETHEFKRWRSLAKKVKLSHNSIVKHQQIIRTFLKWCYCNKFIATDFWIMKVWNIERRENIYYIMESLNRFFSGGYNHDDGYWNSTVGQASQHNGDCEGSRCRWKIRWALRKR